MFVSRYYDHYAHVYIMPMLTQHALHVVLTRPPCASRTILRRLFQRIFRDFCPG